MLSGVAATSATNAWAVGYYSTGSTRPLKTLIVRWNGTAWKQVPSPNVPFVDSELNGVAATSATTAWAVGDSGSYPVNQTLIERWNGASWKRVRSPNPSGSGDSNVLSGVTATSATSAWAVGSLSRPAALIAHWNGTAWNQEPSPIPGLSKLEGTAAASATNAWAVGSYSNGVSSRTLILHCC